MSGIGSPQRHAYNRKIFAALWMIVSYGLIFWVLVQRLWSFFTKHKTVTKKGKKHKQKAENIQQRVFASGHPPTY